MEYDCRSDLGKSIDNTFEKNKDMQNYQLALVNEGRKSILGAKYGLAFEVCKEVFCFRATRPYEIEGPSLYTFDDIRNKFKYKKDVDLFQKEMMEKICESVNGSVDKKNNPFRSYSKNMAAPLFKYNSPNGNLVISKLLMNSVDITLETHCFNWIPGYTEWGREIYGEDYRYHIEYQEERIPLKELTSKKKLFSYIEAFNEDFMDIDNICFEITDVTIDISKSSRSCFDQYYNDHFATWFKRHASYKKDREVLSSKSSYDFCTVNKKLIQLIKYIYLLKIGNNYTDKIACLINNVFENKYKTYITLDENDKKTFRWVMDYLDQKSNVDSERENYFLLYGDESSRYFEYWRSNAVMDYLKDIYDNEYNTDFYKDFLYWLLQMSQ